MGESRGEEARGERKKTGERKTGWGRGVCQGRVREDRVEEEETRVRTWGKRRLRKSKPENGRLRTNRLH